MHLRTPLEVPRHEGKEVRWPHGVLKHAREALTRKLVPRTHPPIIPPSQEVL